MERTAVNPHGLQIMRTLLLHHPEVSITAKVTRNAALNPHCGPAMMKELLHCQPGLRVTNDTIYHSIANQAHSAELLRILLKLLKYEVIHDFCINNTLPILIRRSI